MHPLAQRTPMDDSLDRLEVELLKHPAADLKVNHRFAPGLYIREVEHTAGVMLTSMKHRTKHAFVLSKGRIRVTSDGEGMVVYEAPFSGITEAGTRRGVYAETDAVFTTFHVTDETDIEKIMEAILEPHNNKLIPKLKRTIGWRQSLPPKQLCQAGQ